MGLAKIMPCNLLGLNIITLWHMLELQEMYALLSNDHECAPWAPTFPNEEASLTLSEKLHQCSILQKTLDAAELAKRKTSSTLAACSSISTASAYGLDAGVDMTCNSEVDQIYGSGLDAGVDMTCNSDVTPIFGF